MPVPQLLVLAIIAMAGLATLRVARVRRGLSPLPEGRGRRLFMLGFVVIPPIALGLLTQPPPPANQLWGVGAVPMYAAILAALVTLMWIVAQIVGAVAYGRAAQTARLALAGTQVDPYRIRVDPPLTERLAQDVAVVDRANAAFPRGPGFPSQVNRAGFREDWDDLDTATRALESTIADDRRLGLPVASAATSIAGDARSRLDTLRHHALGEGQAWAAA
jgi:hypothetical protein